MVHLHLHIIFGHLHPSGQILDTAEARDMSEHRLVLLRPADPQYRNGRSHHHLSMPRSLSHGHVIKASWGRSNDGSSGRHVRNKSADMLSRLNANGAF